jgi:PPOX class probable F420-dependent enzyme
MPVAIPETHVDFFQKPVHGVLTTITPDGSPESSIIWVDYDGEYILINPTLQSQKGRNMRANPKVAILVIDPKDSSRWIELRGHVREMTQQGAEAHADKLTQRYCQNKWHFYGGSSCTEDQIGKHKNLRAL